jgi:hypothetical protein
MHQKNTVKILICPLNWGLGHATRCVPVIRQLLKENYKPVIVSDGFPLAFLKLEFPSLRFIEYPSYSIYYAAGKSQVGAMIFNLPSILVGIIQEHFWLKKLVQSEHFDQVISDNRFGMWNKKVHCIYITHQVMVKMPSYLKFLEPLVHQIHLGIINRYNECRIPDWKEKGGLSGDLSHKYPLPGNAIFIGPLSRFQGPENIQPNTEFDAVAVISGIEPQRSLFEMSLVKRFENTNQKILIVAGQPGYKRAETSIGNITIVSHLQDNELASFLLGTRKIIARSGYSTIMDLAALNCLHKAELIPTPGQTEQEYLASIL